MPSLGLGTKTTNSGLITPGIVTDNLVLKHNYNAGSVIPVSDGAAFFDGTDDYINCGSDSSIDIGTSALSVTFWVYLNVVETLTFVGKGPSLSTTTDGTSGWAISLYGSNANVYFDTNTGNNPAERDVVYTSTNSITANRWYHIAVVIPASGDDGRKIYIDGVDKTSVSQHVNTDLGDASVDLWFGDVPTGGTRELNGYMCNVGMWKGRVLTQPQIKSIMNKNYAGLTSSEKTNLVSWWNLDAPITEDYAGIGEGDAPSAIDGLVLDNHDTTLTEVSLTNSDFTSGSGTTITDWNNSNGGLWERSGDTIISPNGVSLLRRNSALTNNVAHKIIVRAKNTIPGSTARLQVYFGGNNHARYDLTDDFQEYVFHGLQTNDTTFILYNPSGGDSTNVTIDWVKLYKYDGNVGLLI